MLEFDCFISLMESSTTVKRASHLDSIHQLPCL